MLSELAKKMLKRLLEGPCFLVTEFADESEVSPAYQELYVQDLVYNNPENEYKDTITSKGIAAIKD